MIVDHMDNLERYLCLGEGFAKAAAFLNGTELAALPLGRRDIDGDRVFALVQENTLQPGDQPFWEAHDLYADIQIVLKGRERFGFGRRGDILPPNPGTDLRPCRHVESFFFDLSDGEFALYLPGEIHASCMETACPLALSRKIVIKVRMG